MQGDFEKQFLKQQRKHFRSLRGMVQNKHQIRINLTNSKTYQQLVHQQQITNNMQSVLVKSTHCSARPTKFENNLSSPQNCQIKQIQGSSRTPTPYLYELVERGRGRMASFSTITDSSKHCFFGVSRSYRRKRSSSQLYHTIEAASSQRQNAKKEEKFMNSTLDVLKDQKNIVQSIIPIQTVSHGDQQHKIVNEKMFQKSPLTTLNNGVVAKKEVKLPLDVAHPGPKRKSKLNSKWMFQARMATPSPPQGNPEDIPSKYEFVPKQAHPFLINMKPSTMKERVRGISRKMAHHNPIQSPFNSGKDILMPVPLPGVTINNISREVGEYYPWEGPSVAEGGAVEDFIH